MSTPRRSRRINKNKEDNNPVPQWFFASFTGDRSGSMRELRGASATGLYDWIKTMKETASQNNQEAYLSVTTFDNVTKKIFNNTNSKDITFTIDDANRVMNPRGTTKLYDTAISDIKNLIKNVNTFREKLHPMVKKLNPEISMTWVCCTDGMDNESKRYDADDLKRYVNYAKKLGIKCFFIAANQDAVTTGQQYGFDGDASLTFSSNRRNAAAAFRSVSYNMRRVSQGSSNTQFTQTMRMNSLATDDYNSDSDDDDIQTMNTLPIPPRSAASLAAGFNPNLTIRRNAYNLRSSGWIPRRSRLVRQFNY